MARSGKWTVAIDPAKLAAFMKSPNGPVYRRFAVAALAVKQGAKRQVGVHKINPADPIPRSRRPGTLRDSIVSRVVEYQGQPIWIVGSDDPIARFHHQGTEPHIIRARYKPFLVFFWAKAGRVVRFKQVNHPGTKPNHYLTDQLPIAWRILHESKSA